MGEFTIELKGLWFFSFHGLYEEERRVGGEFMVDLFVHLKRSDKALGIIDIKDTVNYVSLYEIIKQEMLKPQALLETVAVNIADHIHHTFTIVQEIEVRIVKKGPPIVGFSGSVGVKYHKSY